MTKKSRMSGVIDHSTMGLSIGTEMEISKSTHTSMRRALKKAVKYGCNEFNVAFKLVNGDSMVGDAVYLLSFFNKNGTENSIRYEFRKQGNNHFLNVSGNPTSMVAGSNDIPILIKGFEYGDFKTAAITFKYLNRLMYAALDTLLKEHGFVWEGRDKQRLVDGDISIVQYQIAWYSGDLGDNREDVLQYLRVIYAGQDATQSAVRNVLGDIGIHARVWDNDDGNLTITAYNGVSRNKYFSLTLYAKDRDPLYINEKSTLQRVSNLIRWDCTLSNSFLYNNKIKKIADLEERYIQQCELNGYDIGFIQYIAEKVHSKLNLNYFISVDHTEYQRLVKYAQDAPKTQYEQKLCDYWLDVHSLPIESDTDLATKLGIHRQRVAEAKKNLLNRGLDIAVPRRTLDAILYNRENQMITLEERSEHNMNRHGESSNKVVKIEDKRSRDQGRSKIVSKLLNKTDMQGVMRIRKFNPVKVKPSDFWIYKTKIKEG